MYYYIYKQWILRLVTNCCGQGKSRKTQSTWNRNSRSGIFKLHLEYSIQEYPKRDSKLRNDFILLSWCKANEIQSIM